MRANDKLSHEYARKTRRLVIVNNPLEPIRVEFPDILVWMKESMLLFRRRPLLFLAISLVFFFICHKVDFRGYVTFFIALLLCQITIVVSIVVARCADESRPLTLNIWYQSLLNSILPVVLCSAFYVLMWIIAMKLVSLLMIDELVAESSVPPPIAVLQWLYPGTISLFVIYIGILVTTMWFLLPLSVFHKMGFVDSVLFAKQGERKNFPVVVLASYPPLLIFCVLFAFSELSLVVAVIGLPLFSIYLYVSFRHVYMGRKESQPAKAAVADAVPAESG